MPHVFSEKDKIQGNWIKWEQLGVGGSIQGTFTRKYQRVNQLTGKNQWVYELKDDNGNYQLIGGKDAIDAQMTHVKPGQIIEMRFMEKRPPRVVGHNPTHIIQVYADSKIVDEQWLAEQDESLQSVGTDIEDAEPQSRVAATPQPSVVPAAHLFTKEQKVEKIKTLAVAKLGAKANDPQDIMTKVMEKTGLAFIEANFDQIVKMLEII